ncbi:ABC transporter ATP-binding protein [Salinibacter ruber]|uniref:ABC transporter ATP-binding protein n=1 Tax=Salinibacter ruber TaxID=146919 RepID=UPI0021696B36|nr:ABC transporter transmembrane domain-containing protein [Salinibacter ruber]MCS3757783.1 subfamily B ATP-binding cassette protein MsbA [Salinibacter ruber]MCS3954437.1 subfamily B ATP-binding cassette protein MsbA [Salinibacter ruber]
MPETDSTSEEPSLRPERLWTSLRRILRLGWPYRVRLLGAVVLTVVGAAVALVVPLGLRELVDAVFQQENRALLDWLTVALIVLFLARSAAAFGGKYLLGWTGERVVADLRKKVYRHLHRQSLRFFTDHRTGDLTSRLTNDVGSVRSAVTDALPNFLTQSLSLVGSVALMVVLNWRLSLIIFLIVPAVTGFAIYFGRKIRALARDIQDRLADTTAVAEEALASIRVVKAFARSDYEVDRYNEAVENLFGTARYRVVVTALFESTVGLLFFAALVAIFWYGGIEVLAGRLTEGDLVAFVFYAFNIARSVSSMSQLYSTFNSAAGATERLFGLLDTEPHIRDAPDAIDLPPIDGRVRLDDVTFAYDEGRPVLKDISLDVAAGETVALVGPSGAGKSTLMSLIPRFYAPQEGRVRVDGHDLSDVSRQSLRAQIASVSQEVHLFNATIEENIRYGRLDASDEAVAEAARAANAHDFIVDLPEGYDSEVGERGVKLSGGQRQRVAIARALLRDARLLLLDEATSSLDSASEALVQEALERLMEGRTTFIIAHRLSTVQTADRLFVLDDGRIVQRGTHAELMQAGGLYRRLASYQFREPSGVDEGMLD